MGDPRNLSFATAFNQPKILANASRAVSVPVSALFTPDILFTAATGSMTKPLPPRIAVEYNGVRCPAFGVIGDTFTVLGISVAFIVGYNSANELVVRSYSEEAAPVNVTVYYRIYRDARSS